MFVLAVQKIGEEVAGAIRGNDYDPDGIVRNKKPERRCALRFWS